MSLIASLLIGFGLTFAAMAGADTYRQWLESVEADFRDKLRRLRLKSKNLRAYLLGWLVFVTGVFLVFWILWDMFILGLACCGLLIALPRYVIRRMAERRAEKIEDQLADAMVSLSSAIKAGLSLAQAIEILAQQTPRPICQEFRQMHGEYQLGKPMERCLQETKERLQERKFRPLRRRDGSQSGKRRAVERNRRPHRPFHPGIATAGTQNSFGNCPSPFVGGVHGAGSAGDFGDVLFYHRPRKHRAAVHNRSRPNYAVCSVNFERLGVSVGTRDPESRNLAAQQPPR